MKYYKVRFDSVPKIKFAHRYYTDSYNIRFDEASENELEIVYVEHGTAYMTMSDGEVVINEENQVYTNQHKDVVSGTSKGMAHCHFTVVIGGNIFIEIIEENVDLSLLDCKENFFIIPEKITKEEDVNRVKDLIESIIYNNYYAENHMKNLSNLFSLFHLVTSISLTNIRYNQKKVNFSNIYYSKKVVQYVLRNIDKRIIISDIANSLELSEGHLCRIFKSAMNCTIIQFVNETKINAAKNILKNRKCTISELARQVGIDDEKYFCRLFRKQTGKTVGEYKSILK